MSAFTGCGYGSQSQILNTPITIAPSSAAATARFDVCWFYRSMVLSPTRGLLRSGSPLSHSTISLQNRRPLHLHLQRTHSTDLLASRYAQSGVCEVELVWWLHVGGLPGTGRSGQLSSEYLSRRR